MNFRYTATRIHEIVKADKALVDGYDVSARKKGSQGLGFEAYVELLDGPFMDIAFRGKAGVSNDPTTYDSNLFLDQQRVRGVGYCPVGRQNFRAKQRIPKGWHQNILDPNQRTNAPGFNRHEALPDFKPVDFEDFTRKSAELWSIDLAWDRGLV